ncbi:hypothetical protein ABKN59_003489 [Abortiporus biennis]
MESEHRIEGVDGRIAIIAGWVARTIMIWFLSRYGDSRQHGHLQKHFTSSMQFQSFFVFVLLASAVHAAVVENRQLQSETPAIPVVEHQTISPFVVGPRSSDIPKRQLQTESPALVVDHQTISPLLVGPRSSAIPKRQLQSETPSLVERHQVCISYFDP